MDERQITAIISEKGPINFRNLLALAKPADRAIVELKVLHMVKKGVLRAERAGKDIMLAMGVPVEVPATGFSNAEVALVVTLPVGVSARHMGPTGYMDMLDALTLLITGARRELRICSPFADYETVAVLYPSFRKAASKGVYVKILVRSASSHKLLTTLKGIKDIYSKLGMPERFAVRRYEVSVAGLLVEAVHAKLVISDRDAAYVGSGELRKHSLTADVEVGVLMRGAAVMQLVELFDAVWERAEKLI